VTGPEHYREAERFAAEADTYPDADLGWKGNLDGEERIRYRMADLAAAQVHATLALAAATALTGDPDGLPAADWVAWGTAAGEPNPPPPAR
jgi:hypothetical protein